MSNKTLLNAVNEILIGVNAIAGDANALTSLTDSARQHPIDMCIRVINEGIDELYSYSGIGMPDNQAESTFTLATSTLEYSLATDLVQLHFPIIDKTNTQYIWPFPGGYDEMLVYDPEQDDTGIPYYAAISPVNGKLHLDRQPTSAENGRVYTYQYEKNLGMTNATDTVPFNDTVFRAMVPAWIELYKRRKQNEFDAELYKMGLGRACRYLSEREPKTSYNPRSYRSGFTVWG